MPSSIEQLVIETSKQLKANEWKLVTVESCTGGGLAYALTNIPGSSTWFERGFGTPRRFPFRDFSYRGLLGRCNESSMSGLRLFGGAVDFISAPC